MYSCIVVNVFTLKLVYPNLQTIYFIPGINQLFFKVRNIDSKKSVNKQGMKQGPINC